LGEKQPGFVIVQEWREGARDCIPVESRWTWDDEVLSSGGYVQTAGDGFRGWLLGNAQKWEGDIATEKAKRGRI
jgi:hypothetical protein